MNSQKRPKPEIYELIWRQFNRKWIQEQTLLVLPNRNASGRMDGLQAGQLREGNLVHKFSAGENGFLKDGFPLPKLGGFSPRWEGDTRIRVFMDDLFLCPDCGKFHAPQHFLDDVNWLNNCCSFFSLIETPEAEAAMFIDIKRRKDKKEFEIRRCESRDYCESRVKNFLDAFKLQENEAELQAALKFERENLKQPPDSYVYLIKGKEYVKIGIAVHVDSRLSGLQTGAPFKLQLLKSWKCLNARHCEQKLHGRFKKFHQNGEWFQLPDEVLRNLIAVENLDDFVKP